MQTWFALYLRCGFSPCFEPAQWANAICYTSSDTVLFASISSVTNFNPGKWKKALVWSLTKGLESPREAADLNPSLIWFFGAPWLIAA